MKKILVLGAGAMGSAFTLPCIENKNKVILVGTHLENELVKNLNKNSFHPALNANLPKNLKYQNLRLFNMSLNLIQIT